MKNLLFGLLLMSGTVFAKEAGNGGQVVVCYNPNNTIHSVELMDFHEGRTLDNRHIPEQTGNFLEIYNKIAEKSVNDDFKNVIKEGLEIVENLKFLPPAVRLKAIDDSAEIFIPNNCKIEQLANYKGANRIFVVADFWNHLSETSKAGLILHEALWAMDRKNGVTKSARIRRIVAEYFDPNINFEAFEVLPIFDYHRCSTNTKDLKTIFDMKVDREARLVTFHFYTINGGNLHTRYTALHKLDIGEMDYYSYYGRDNRWNYRRNHRWLPNSQKFKLKRFPDAVSTHDLYLSVDIPLNREEHGRTLGLFIRIDDLENSDNSIKATEFECSLVPKF